MNFIYFGSSEFSKVVLGGLYQQGLKPLLVVTKPDKPKGRGLKISATQVSLLAKSKNTPVVKPQSLKEVEFYQRLNKLETDFFIVVDYGKIIPGKLLSIPGKFSLGLHPSLLPRYRGPAPIEYTLLNGDRESGLTVFKINDNVDSGDIILQRKVSVDYNDDYHSLSQKLADQGASVLTEALSKIESGSYKLTKQDESKVSFSAKFKKVDGQISWQLPAQSIRNLIRATIDWPSAYTYYKDLMLKIIKAEVVDIESQLRPGGIVKIERDGIYVATGEQFLRILRIQPLGKKIMDAWAFVCGHRLEVGERFGK